MLMASIIVLGVYFELEELKQLCALDVKIILFEIGLE